MWKTTPAKPSRLHDTRRRVSGGLTPTTMTPSTTARSRDTSRERSCSPATVASPPPRLAPLTNTVSSSSTSAIEATPLMELRRQSSITSASGSTSSTFFLMQDAREARRTHPRSVPRLMERMDATTTDSIALAHSSSNSSTIPNTSTTTPAGPNANTATSRQLFAGQPAGTTATHGSAQPNTRISNHHRGVSLPQQSTNASSYNHNNNNNSSKGGSGGAAVSGAPWRATAMRTQQQQQQQQQTPHHSHQSTPSPPPPPPPLPHLAALANHRPWPVEMPWRRSKPLTRRLTTTVNATIHPHPHRQQQQRGPRRELSKHLGTGRALTPTSSRRSSLAASLSREGGGSKAGNSRNNSNSGKSDASKASASVEQQHCSLPLSRPQKNRTESEKRPSASVPMLPVSMPQPDVDGLQLVPVVLSKVETFDHDDVNALVGQRRDEAVGVSAVSTSFSAVPQSADPAPPAGSGPSSPLETQPEPFFLFEVDHGASSDYAAAHQLPQLFAEMVRDLALAQAQLLPLQSGSTANQHGVEEKSYADDHARNCDVNTDDNLEMSDKESDLTESGLVEQWIQHWFRHRYDRTRQGSPELAMSPDVRRAQRHAAPPTPAVFAAAAGAKKLNVVPVALRSGERRRSSQPSASPSATTSITASSSTSLNQRFISLTVQPCSGPYHSCTNSSSSAAATTLAQGAKAGGVGVEVGNGHGVARGLADSADEAPLCASLNSAHHASHGEVLSLTRSLPPSQSHQQQQPHSHLHPSSTSPMPPPPPPSATTIAATGSNNTNISSSSGGGGSIAVSAPLRPPSKSKSPPTSAGAAHVTRPPRSNGQTTTTTTTATATASAVKLSGASASSLGGAAGIGNGRGPAMSACAIVGGLTSVTQSEAAPTAK